MFSLSSSERELLRRQLEEQVAASFRIRFDHLSLQYRQRLLHLTQELRLIRQKLVTDPAIALLQRDPASAQHLQSRVHEIMDQMLSSEREGYIELLVQQLASKESECSSLKSNIRELEAAMSQTSNTKSDTNTPQQSAEAKQLLLENDRLQNQLHSLSSELQSARLEFERTKEMHMKTQEKDTQIIELQVRLKDCDQKLSELGKNYSAKQEEIISLRSNLNQKDEKLDVLIRENQILLKSLEDAKSSGEMLTKSMNEKLHAREQYIAEKDAASLSSQLRTVEAKFASYAKSMLSKYEEQAVEKIGRIESHYKHQSSNLKEKILSLNEEIDYYKETIQTQNEEISHLKQLLSKHKEMSRVERGDSNGDAPQILTKMATLFDDVLAKCPPIKNEKIDRKKSQSALKESNDVITHLANSSQAMCYRLLAYHDSIRTVIRQSQGKLDSEEARKDFRSNLAILTLDSFHELCLEFDVREKLCKDLTKQNGKLILACQKIRAQCSEQFESQRKIIRSARIDTQNLVKWASEKMKALSQSVIEIRENIVHEKQALEEKYTTQLQSFIQRKEKETNRVASLEQSKEMEISQLQRQLDDLSEKLRSAQTEKQQKQNRSIERSETTPEHSVRGLTNASDRILQILSVFTPYFGFGSDVQTGLLNPSQDVFWAYLQKMRESLKEVFVLFH